MTAAAVILSASAEGALTDTLGQPRVRRLVDIAWSGGALPVVVVSPDADGAVLTALAGSEATYGAPAPQDAGPVGQMLKGAEMAMDEVSETTAFLLWPARMVWVGPETVTSLIEAHGTDLGTMLRPAWHGEPGWPVLVPSTALGALRAVGSDRTPPDVIEELVAAVPSRVVEVGDPGVHFDAETAFADLPDYEGPPDPPAGHTHEWGDEVAGRGVDADVPGEGRGLAPFPQAEAEESADS
ncbi:MAG TPA: NTP transferase domain-containing protein [Candidatus Limnocylindrales bacterium]|jgi:CTP:molybdopterin cytidylyltransferase MocA|nr:NTP transferase domain-containing protein [Candidatus Limnocylindrales bacterium]